MSERPLSGLMVRCLQAMAALETQCGRVNFTPNEIGIAAGAKTVYQRRGDPGTKGPAQQIIRPLSALERRGLIAHTKRNDELSGTAYCRTLAGKNATPALQTSDADS